MTYSFHVFMSTYNGAKYLPEQIQSILAQEGTDVTLWVRDDGSKDATKEIIGEFAERTPSHVRFTPGVPFGIGRSFMSLVYGADETADFYAFSDQDDIWDQDKLRIASQALAPYQDVPALYVCNQRCVSTEGEFLYQRFPADFPKQELHNALLSNLYAGCTMVWNQALMNLLKDETRRPPLEFFENRIHDAWTTCLACATGQIIYDSACHMSFRRHNSNATDSEIYRGQRFELRKLIKRQKGKVKRFLHSQKRMKHGCELTAIYLLKGYSDKILDISRQDRELLFLLRDYRNSIFSRVKLAVSPIVASSAPESRFSLSVKALLGML